MNRRVSDGQYRDSSEIAAAVDCLLELVTPGPNEDQAVRKIRGRGRWTVEPFTVALRDGDYILDSGIELSMDAQVLLHIEANSGTSTTTIREKVGGRGSKVDAVVNQLVARGAIENRGTANRSAFHSTATEPRMGGI